MKFKTFKVGDVVRSRKPYFGEPAYKVLRVGANYGDEATGSKHGSGGYKTGDVKCSKYYKKCSLIARAWLCLLGKAIEARNRRKNRR